jgi:hypothetical protein
MGREGLNDGRVDSIFLKSWVLPVRMKGLTGGLVLVLEVCIDVGAVIAAIVPVTENSRRGRHLLEASSRWGALLILVTGYPTRREKVQANPRILVDIIARYREQHIVSTSRHACVGQHSRSVDGELSFDLVSGTLSDPSRDVDCAVSLRKEIADKGSSKGS